jgi:hypothetical protein
MNTMSDTDRSFTAVVHAADGIRFVASAPSSADLANELVAYIAARCDDSLWPSVAAEVHAYIDDGNPDAAIATYFANVGQRWDHEWLELDPSSGSSLFP